VKLGFVTAIFPDLELAEVLQFAAEVGYDCVEVMCWPPGGGERKFAGVSHIDVTNLSQSQGDDIRGLCENHGVSISGLGYYPNILSANAEEGDLAHSHLKKVMDAASLLGLKNVNTFIGNNHTQPFEVNFEKFQHIWPELIRYAEQRGLFIGIENCPMLFSLDEWPGGKNMAKSPEIWRKMFEAIPSDHFGLNYDPSHIVMQMMDYIEPIVDFPHKLFHVHAKDMKVEHRKLNQVGVQALPPEWTTPKIPGLGDVDWSRFVSSLTDADYNGPICVEMEDDAFSRTLEDRKRSLVISHNVLRPLIG